MTGIYLAEECVLFKIALEMLYLWGEMGAIILPGLDLCLLNGEGTFSSRF
jgi:hypothetical protein